MLDLPALAAAHPILLGPGPGYRTDAAGRAIPETPKAALLAALTTDWQTSDVLFAAAKKALGGGIHGTFACTLHRLTKAGVVEWRAHGREWRKEYRLRCEKEVA